MVKAMLQFEAALVKAQAAQGLIPQDVALSIVGTCKIELFDLEKLSRDGARCANLAAPLLRQLRDMVGIFNPTAVPFVHWGVSNRDLLDTAMALVTNDVLDLIYADLNATVHTLLTLANLHLKTPMLVREGMRAVAVSTLGLRCVDWAIPLERCISRLQMADRQAIQVRLGMVAQSPNLLQRHASDVAQRMSVELGIGTTSAPWQPRRDAWVALGCELGLMVASLGKIAHEVKHLCAFEVGELLDVDGIGWGTQLVSAVKAAQHVPMYIATLMMTMPHESELALVEARSDQTEWLQLLGTALAATRAMRHVLAAMTPDLDRMQANIAAAGRSGEQIEHVVALAKVQLQQIQQHFVD